MFLKVNTSVCYTSTTFIFATLEMWDLKIKPNKYVIENIFSPKLLYF